MSLDASATLCAPSTYHCCNLQQQTISTNLHSTTRLENAPVSNPDDTLAICPTVHGRIRQILDVNNRCDHASVESPQSSTETKSILKVLVETSPFTRPPENATAILADQLLKLSIHTNTAQTTKRPLSLIARVRLRSKHDANLVPAFPTQQR